MNVREPLEILSDTAVHALEFHQRPVELPLQAVRRHRARGATGKRRAERRDQRIDLLAQALGLALQLSEVRLELRIIEFSERIEATGRGADRLARLAAQGITRPATRSLSPRELRALLPRPLPRSARVLDAPLEERAHDR